MLRSEIHGRDGGYERAWTVTAGLPLYVALFGRDTLTAGWEAALLGPEIMRGTLAELARWQATWRDDWRDEQPGRMLRRGPYWASRSAQLPSEGRDYSSVTASNFYPWALRLSRPLAHNPLRPPANPAAFPQPPEVASL